MKKPPVGERVVREDVGDRLLGSTLRCLELLDVLSEFTRPVSLVEVVDAMPGISRSTAYKRLNTLVAAGWVEKDRYSRYRLSLKAARFGAQALEQASLGLRVLPVMQRLSAQTGESVSIVVLDVTDLLFVQRVESDQILSANLRVGAHLPICGNASGEVLVAFASESRISALKKANATLPPEGVLDSVRQRGASFASMLSGISVVSAPIFDPYGYAQASLAVAGPESRYHPSDCEVVVKDTAAVITEMVGGHR